ncbi:hypothetical protein STCU_12123 [Strigomonas culicis]|uniref:Uncharacterized protein n=1 Tax=Strigomonas culicis TaxID=28005 RepID=S9TBC5_9TRYP|nr:hypothetical protein STCU_12123 [Strigomonas culicis]|eukprot:EPY15317.1 hypothetical protein STCU_12123 [Strigomonas culicis]
MKILTESFQDDFQSLLGKRIGTKDSWLWDYMIYEDYSKSWWKHRPSSGMAMPPLSRLLWSLPFVLAAVLAASFLAVQLLQVRLHRMLASLRDVGAGGATAPAARRASSLTEEVIAFALFKLRSRTSAAERLVRQNMDDEKKQSQETWTASHTAEGVPRSKEGPSTLRQRRTEEAPEAAKEAAPATSFTSFKARLDQEKRAVGEADDANEEDEAKQVGTALRVLGEDRRIWYYTYPYVSLFRQVLEPHYTCEVFLYTFIAMLMVLLVLGGSLMTPAAQHSDWILLPFFGTTPYPSPYHDTFVFFLVHIVSVVSVIGFTTVNLGTTAKEHRAFWTGLNEERSMVLTLLAGVDSFEMSSTLSGREASARYTNARSTIDVELGDDEEHQRRRYQNHLDFLLTPEVFPPFNLFNNLW